jgi:O-antigen/teichoic acid export membrane protein
MTGARRLAHNVGWNVLAQAWLLALAVVSTPYLVDRLGVEEYGLYTLALALLAWIAVLDLGLGAATVKLVSEERGRGESGAVRRIVGTSVALHLALGGAGAAGLALLAPVVARLVGLGDGGVTTLRLAALAALGVVLLAACTAVPTALQRLDLVNRRTIAFGSVTVLATVAAVAAGGGVNAALLVLIAANAVALASFARLSRRLLPDVPLRARLDRRAARGLLGFGALKAVGQASTQAVYHLDKLIVGALLGVAALTYYAIPVLVAQRLLALVGSVATVFFPAASELYGRADAKRLEELYIRASKLVAIVVLPSAMLLAVFAEPLLRLWVGEDFASESTWPLRLLLAGYALNALTAMPALACDAVGRPRINAGWGIATGVVNVALSFALIPPFGLVGAAGAILLTSALLLPPFLLHVHRHVLGTSVVDLVRRALLRPAVATALALVPAIALAQLADSLALLLASGLTAAAVTLGATFLVRVYDQTDRDVLRATLRPA